MKKLTKRSQSQNRPLIFLYTMEANMIWNIMI